MANKTHSELAEYALARTSLRGLREKRGLTLRELGMMLGKDVSYLAKRERGEKWIPPSLQEEWAAALGGKVDALFRSRGKYRPREADIQERMLADAGACGSPTCSDSECAVAPGDCHSPECSKLAVVAPATAHERRWVNGRPTLYCSPACAQSDGRAQRDRLRAQGWHSAADVGRMLGRDPHSVVAFAGRILGGRRIGRQVPGIGGPHGGIWWFADADVKVIRARVETNPHADPGMRSDWYMRRFGSTKMFGREAAKLALRRGKKVGRPPKVSPEQRARILELHVAGKYGQRTIAEMVGVSRGTVRNIIDTNLVG